MRKFILSIAAFLLTAMVIIPGGRAVAADEGEAAATLPSLVVSATRYEMPQSHVASDITVITKEDISYLPVHDLSEALNYIPGLVIDRNGGPGQTVTPSIQGSDTNHIKFVIDDIPLSLLSGDAIDLTMMPVENIERVEIVKGSASSVWGASLGGVVNIVTRSPTDEPTAEIGFSLGDKETRKYNGLASGKKGGIGYFLSAGRMETDGFFSNQKAEINTLYGKLIKDIGNGYSAEVSYGHSDADRGLGQYYDPYAGATYSADNEMRDSYGRLKLGYSNGKDLDTSVSIYDRVFYYKRTDTYDIPSTSVTTGRENSYGMVLKSGWKYSSNGVLSAGAEGSHATTDWNYYPKEYDTDKGAIYLNDIHTAGPLTLNTAIRYDNDSVFGSDISPSAGVVFDAGHSTLFRLNAARGFTPPPLLARYWGNGNTDLHAERAWTYQAGIESHIIPMLLAKATFFRADIEEMLDWLYDPLTYTEDKVVNINKARRQGVEVEAKTDEYKGLSLSYGYAFNDIRDLEADATIKNRARITHDAGVSYRGPLETMTTVKGHYVWLNADDGWPFNAKDKNFIWDAKVSKYFAKWKGVMGELFVSVHNIFDEDQFLMEIYPNPGRWIEGGVSLTFY